MHIPFLTARRVRPGEGKASRTAPLIAFQAHGRPAWTPRDYAALAREGFAKNAPVSLTLSNFKITTSSGTNSDCIHVACAGARVTLGAGMNFGASAGAHMRILNNGHVFATAAYAISGAIGAGGHVWTQFGGLFEAYALTVTITGTPALGPFAAAESGGAQIWYGMTFSGSATGARYSATLNGVLNAFGGGASYFPGNAGGSTATGGQYA